MTMFQRRRHEVPGLNTASLPDLIFTVLFFFMIVTHMQKVAVKVQFRTPQGTELTRLTKKTSVTYIYIGRPSADLRKTFGNGTRIQLNDKFTPAAEVADYVTAERNRMSPEDQEQMTVSICQAGPSRGKGLPYQLFGCGEKETVEAGGHKK